VAPAPASAEDRRLLGEWKALTYVIDGRDHPMDGLFIFTPKYFSANVIFKLSNGPVDDANANAGPYEADGSTITFVQWMQLHVRPGDKAEPLLLTTGIPEKASYAIEGDRLVITFPSANKYVLERLR
jgi:hypothetical protein